MLKPGERATVRVIFGLQYGHKPGYALNPREVVNFLMFTGTCASPKSFRIESLVAGGRAGEHPPLDPESVRTMPKNGVLLGPGVEDRSREASGSLRRIGEHGRCNERTQVLQIALGGRRRAERDGQASGRVAGT